MLTDFRYAVRLLVATPGWTLVAGLSLALGIAANAVVFSVVDAVLLNPFPYKEPDRLVLLWGSKSQQVTPGISGADLDDWRTQSRAFDDIDAYLGNLSFSLGPDERARVPAACIGHRVLPMLGVQPLLGRNFTAEEARYRGEPVVLLSHDLWRSQFSANPDIVGRIVRLNDQPYSVIGVMPPRFFFPDTDARLWVPAPCGMPGFQARGSQSLHAIGRIRQEETIASAGADLDVIAERLARAYPATNKNRKVGIFPLRQVVIGEYQRALLFLVAGVGLVLLIACANIVHLHLARGLQRETEIAIRAAAGASRGRLVRQLLTETATLIVPAGGFALLLTWAGLRALEGLSLTDVPRMEAAQLNLRVVAFTIGASVIATLLSGLWPAWHLSSAQTTGALRVGGSSTRTRRSSNLRDLLAISEIALAVILLVVGGLVVRSFVELSRADWGFDPDKLLLLQVTLPRPLARNIEAQREFSAMVKTRLERTPEVANASVSHTAPIRWNAWAPKPLLVDGRIVDGFGVWTVGDGYFSTVGVPILEGRDFGAQDTHQAPRRMIISRAAAQRLWASESPVGRHVAILEMRTNAGKRDPAAMDRLRQRGRLELSDMQVVGGEQWEIIGVVSDVRMFGLDIRPDPAVYIDARQRPMSGMWGIGATELKVLVRSEGDPGKVTDAAKAAIRAVEPDVTFTEAVMMSELVSRSIGGRGSDALMAAIGSTFATLALFFAGIGVYGVMSHSISLRLQEIGIRIALGAGRNAIAGMVVAYGVRLLLSGVSLGFVIAWAVTRGMDSFLFDITPTDTLTYLGTAGIIGVAVLLACVSPISRALRFDPASLFRA